MALFRPLLVLLLALTANASTVSVQPGECTLQSAVDMASSGDILLLADGTFTCGTNANVVSVSKTLTIKAQNSRQAILDGEGARRVVKIGSSSGPWSNSGPSVTLEGLQITRGKNVMAGSTPAFGDNGAGVYIDNQHTTVSFTDCKIDNNSASGHIGFGGGVFVVRATTSFDGCEITQNHAEYTGGGLYFDLGTHSISGTNITDNSANMGGGFYGNFESMTITNSKITGNTASTGAAYSTGALNSVTQSLTLSCVTVAGTVRESVPVTTIPCASSPPPPAPDPASPPAPLPAPPALDPPPPPTDSPTAAPPTSSTINARSRTVTVEPGGSIKINTGGTLIIGVDPTAA